MMQNLLDPVVVFFLMGIFSRLLNVSLAFPSSIYDTMSIYLLLAIGLKGGYELNQLKTLPPILPFIGAVIIGMIVPTITFFIAKKIKHFSTKEAVALAAHYGAASAVTFAVVLNYMEDNGFQHEGYFTVFLVIIEVCGILTAFSFLHLGKANLKASLTKIFHDVLLNKSIFLMLMGIFVGWISSVKGFGHVKILFIDLFKGILCFFMLEMGLVCGQQFEKIKENKRFIISFGIVMPLIAGLIGILMAKATGLSSVGAAILATIAASASYIAAPVVTRSVLPDVNLSVPLACSLGVTFPFNVLVGIPFYFYLANLIYTV
jgi:hypothetical protein